jgi:hypothetical protein
MIKIATILLMRCTYRKDRMLNGRHVAKRSTVIFMLDGEKLK